MILEYPAHRQTLYNWIHQKQILPEEKFTFRGHNTKDHPRPPSLEQKLQILHRYFGLGQVVRSASIVLMNPPDERSRGKAVSLQEIGEEKVKPNMKLFTIEKRAH